MASKIKKTNSGTITGIFNKEDMSVEVEDYDEPIMLADFFEEFDDKEVTIKIGYTNEL